MIMNIPHKKIVVDTVKTVARRKLIALKVFLEENKCDLSYHLKKLENVDYSILCPPTLQRAPISLPTTLDCEFMSSVCFAEYVFTGYMIPKKTLVRTPHSHP